MFLCKTSVYFESNSYVVITVEVDFHSEMCCEMERNLLRVLEGGCKVPIATRCDILSICKYCNLWNSIERNQCQACYQQININNQKNIQLRFYIYGLVLSQDGNTKIQSMETKSLIINHFNLSKLNERNHNQYQQILGLSKQIGQTVANKLKSKGAQEIINHIKQEAIKEMKTKNT